MAKVLYSSPQLGKRMKLCDLILCSVVDNNANIVRIRVNIGFLLSLALLKMNDRILFFIVHHDVLDKGFRSFLG